jgi:sigma-B regulation protein RsbU (phosphoserine phosphatase)
MIFDLKDKKMFLTASSISIHPGKMEFIVAGHLPLLIYRKGTKKIEELTIRQIPVGMKKDFEFLEGEFSLESGDFVVMVTDGVPETFSKSKELFSMERLKRIIEENAVEESGKLNQNILMEVEKFGIPDDDLTILTIKRN